MTELKKVDYIKHDPSYFDKTVHSKLRRVALALSGAVVGIHSSDNTDLWEDGTTVDWSAYETNGWNCMVQIPKFYYKVEIGTLGVFEDVYRCEVCEIQRDGYKLHPLFNRVDNVIEDYQYIGAFEGWVDGIERLRSLPKKNITVNRNRTNFRGAAQLNGSDFGQMDYLQLSAIQMLFITEYATMNSQQALGNGRTGNNSITSTGESLKNGNGSYGNKGVFSDYMSYRGIENLWGNSNSFVDGAMTVDYVMHISKRDFSDINNSDYISTGLKIFPSGWIKNFHKSTGKYDFTFIPSVSGGSMGTYLTDYYTAASGTRVPYLGGVSTDATNAPGIFSLYFAGIASLSGSTIGSRLSYILS